MNRLIPTLLSLALMASPALADKNMAHVHMGHVTSGWTDTPEQQGLLPTAQKEAAVAAQHADLAANKPGDLSWMKLHTGHVLHAIDPSREPQGPGLGYGVQRAAAGVAKHIELAAGSPGASANVKLHAEHVATSARNTVERARRIAELGARVRSADNAAEAAPAVREIQALSHALMEGEDANGDGRITWHQGEGGLAAVEQHMALMAKGEGL